MSINLAVAAALKGSDIAHSHTWYANFAGHLAKLMWSIPHVMTIHSLEPLRPWKAEQLGGGYALSLFCERTAVEAADAVIAVSRGVRNDVLECYPSVDPARVHVIHNGIDPEIYKRRPADETMARYGIDANRPYAFFNGRITRQKGLPHLLAAALKLDAKDQLVICASSPDTPEIGAEVNALVARVRAEGRDLVWIDHFIPREDLIHLHSGATVFVCPSVYEPFGLVILEAMACETAVVASVFRRSWSKARPASWSNTTRATARLSPPISPPRSSWCWTMQRWPERWAMRVASVWCRASAGGRSRPRPPTSTKLF